MHIEVRRGTVGENVRINVKNMYFCPLLIYESRQCCNKTLNAGEVQC